MHLHKIFYALDLLVELLLSPRPEAKKITEYLTHLRLRINPLTWGSTANLLNDEGAALARTQMITQNLERFSNI